MSEPVYNPAATKAMWACALAENPDHEGIIAALDNGADPNQLDDELKSVLYILAGGRTEPDEAKLAAIRKLVEKGANIDQRCLEISAEYADPYRGDSPLFSAAYRGYPEIVGLLLALGANPNHRNYMNETALFATQDPESAIRLIEAGLDLSVRNKKQNRTAFKAWGTLQHEALLNYFSDLPQDMRKLALYQRIHPHLSKELQQIWQREFDPTSIIRQAAASATRDSAVARYLANSSDHQARRP